MNRWLVALIGFVLRTLSVTLRVLALLSFLLAVVFSCEGVLALFAAYRIHTTGHFLGLAYTAQHVVRVAIEAFIMAAFLFWPAYVFHHRRESREVRSIPKRGELD